MVRLQDISIKQKLTAIIMIAGTVALLLASAGFVAYELITYPKVMTDDLSTLAAIIGDRSTAALAFDNKSDAEETLGRLLPRDTSAPPVFTTRTVACLPNTRRARLHPVLPRPGLSELAPGSKTVT